MVSQFFIAVMLRAGTALENLILGSLAAAAACCVMIPVDTVKTRLVTQGAIKHYHGMIHCFQTVRFIVTLYILYTILLIFSHLFTYIIFVYLCFYLF